MNTKAKLVAIVVMVLIIVATTTETKSGVRTEVVTVAECVAIDDCYEVTVEDTKGNLWAYYDSDCYPNGKELRVTYKGNEITNVTMIRK